MTGCDQPCEPVGYFLRNTAAPDGWPASASVTEICSVSQCINLSPPGWIDRWLHNDLGFFNTRADAESVAPQGSRGFTMFAYRLLPARFEKGQAEALPPEHLPVEPLPSNFVSLGFDVVSKSISAFFECSPLSCNGMAGEVFVNRFCLLETLEEATAFALRCSREEPEPGCYFVLEVLREQRS